MNCNHKIGTNHHGLFLCELCRNKFNNIALKQALKELDASTYAYQYRHMLELRRIVMSLRNKRGWPLMDGHTVIHTDDPISKLLD